jgi:predicted amidohydrolase
VRVACATVAPVIRDVEGNAARVARAIDGVDADVVVLPELALSGYAFESVGEARAGALGPDSWARPGARAGAIGPDSWARPGKVVVGGFAELAGDVLYNAAAIVDGSGVRAVYRKAHLWDREPSWFAAGDAEPPVVDTEHGRIAVMICFDLFFPEWVRIAALRGAELLCVPGNWPAPEHGDPPQPARASVAAEANGIAIALCDRHDEERGLRFAGASCIAAPDGRLLGCGAGATADVRPGGRSPLGFRRPELYRRLSGPGTAAG